MREASAQRSPQAAWGAGLLLCAVLAPAASAQTLGQGADDGISLWRVLAALVLCLALAVAGAFAVKKRTDGRTPTLGSLFQRDPGRRRRLKLIETLRIAPQVELCIVACDGRELLVATSGGDVTVIEHLPISGRLPADGRPET